MLGNYKIIEQIGNGSFGIIFKGIHSTTKTFVAIKRGEKNKTSFINEIKICNHLSNIKGIYKLRWYGSDTNFNYIIFDLLGNSLTYYIKKYKKLKLSTIKILSKQIINIISHVHSRGILHRDIKSDNFMMGYKDSDQIYLIDYGLSKSYLDNNIHVECLSNNSCIGSYNYMSLFVHEGLTYSRRDDMLSIAYLFIYMYKGYLDWENSLKEEIIERKKKLFISNKILSTYYNSVKSLKFYDKPDYNLYNLYLDKLSHYSYLEWNNTIDNLETNI